MNNDNFLIEENDLIPAKEICKYIENSEIRNRATANSTAALIAKKYFEECDIDINTGLHNVAQVLEDIEISDIYINDNYLDVRIYFNDNELCVPKSHFDRAIQPVAYMFIKLNEDLTGGVVTGFLTPNAVNTENEVNGYYPVNENELISYYDIESFLIHKDEIDITSQIESQVFDYLDNKLQDINAFYRTLIDSRELRIKLINAAKAKLVFSFVSINEPIQKSLVTQDSIELIDEETTLNDTIEPIDKEDLNLDLTPDEEDGEIDDLTEVNTDEFNEIEDFDTTLDSDSLEEVSLFEEDEAIGFIDNNETLLEEEDDDNEELIEEAAENETDSLIETYEPVAEESSDEILMQDTDALEEEEEEDISIKAEDTTESEIVPLEGFIEDDEPDMTAPIEEYSSENISDISELDLETNDEPSSETIEEEEEENNYNEFSTSITPSLDTYEEQINETANLEDMIEDNSADIQTESTEAMEEDNSPQIDTLFNAETDSEVIEETFVQPQKKKSLLLPIIGTAAIIGALGYFGYTKFMPAPPQPEEIQERAASVVKPDETEHLQEPEAMPLETVENTVKPIVTNEGTSVSIPAIENNLDASILVSNLTIKWEVPSAYSTNATAKRYFTKMGKIIQLNLKTELLLLNKPPITNKITLELEFNKASNKFIVKGITASSGEQTVDDIITRTVKNALDMNLNMNMSSFGNIQGNPVLIINL